jgi:putative DNA-invertase from lambdoid prophage Rac
MILSYCRVSTLEQANASAVSLPEQEKKNRLIAQMRGCRDFDIQTYIDPGMSGATCLEHRPAGKKMLADARKGDIIVAAKLDRLFRNALDALSVIKDLRERGVDVILGDISHEPISASATAQMFFTMLAAFAQFEHGRIAERINEGRAGKKARGGFLGGRCPYGFRVVGTGRSAQLEPDENEQRTLATVRDIYERFTPVNAMRELERMGIRNRKGGVFGMTEIRRMANGSS